MKYPFSIISVFLDPEFNFKGNTAAIVELEEILPERKMQEIASNLNQPATTFIWKSEEEFHVRWFAPDAEIGLCGHGSMAAFVYLDRSDEIALNYRGGKIKGRKDGELYSMILDAIMSNPEGIPDTAIVKGIDKKVIEYYSNDNKNIVVLENEESVRSLKPEFSVLQNMDPFGIIVTAPGNDADFVSRTLVPKVQQLEDHATGSSHAALTPFWSERLGKKKMISHQLSPRGGKFICELSGDKVILSGKAKTISTGYIYD